MLCAFIFFSFLLRGFRDIGGVSGGGHAGGGCAGRRNEAVRMNFLGMLPFTAPYLPWVLLTFSALLGSPLSSDMVSLPFGTFREVDDSCGLARLLCSEYFC